MIYAVVVNYRTPELAVRCARSFMDNAGVPGHVRIVDTSGGPGVITNPPINVPVHTCANVGYGRALNLGFEDAQLQHHPVLLAMNADVEVPADGLAPILDLFAEHPRLGVLGVRQVTPDTNLIAHAGVPQLGDPRGGRGYGEIDSNQYIERYLAVEQVSGSVMFIRHEAFVHVGRMPKALKLYYEDAWLCMQMARHGWEIGYTGLRTFAHHVAASPEPAEGRAVLAQQSRTLFEQEAAR